MLGALAEWIRAPGTGGSWLVAALALAVAAALAPHRGTAIVRGLAALLVVIAVIVPVRQRAISALSSDWPAERERRIDAASRRLEGDLRADLRRIVTIASRAADLAGQDDEALFHALPALVPRRGVETGVVLFRPDGTPRAWAGRHRLLPEPEGDSLAARAAPYLHLFETRRHLADGSVVVASLLLDADRTIPGAAFSLSERFRRRTEVGLEVFAPDQVPDGDDIFDYEEPTTDGPRVLFSVRPVPPTQGEATLRTVAGAGRLATFLGTAVIILAIATAGGTAARVLLLGMLFWLAYRTPALEAAGLDYLASPAIFYRGLPGGVALVAGPLLLAGFICAVLGVWRWRRQAPSPLWARGIGALLLLATPFLVRTLGQGITPPVDGVSVPLWLTWETTLLLATAGLIIPAAGFLRGGREARGVAPPLIGAALACIAAALGLWAWEGRSGWPDWYTLLWLPALVLVTRPAARWATILGIAIAAGSAASLMTWGAELEGRVELARRDLLHLGPDPELLAEPMLRGFAEELRRGPAPTSAAGLLVAWRRSGLDRQGYPARLELRDGAGAPRAVVALDQLDLPDSLVARRVGMLRAEQADTVLAVARSPGVHFLLVLRLEPDAVAVVALGPRTQLVAPGRIGRLLRPPSVRRPAYAVTLSPGAPLAGGEVSQVRWRREGWLIRGERTVLLPDGPRQAFATVDMLGPVPLLIRGALVLFLNVILLALLWRLAEFLTGDPLGRVRLGVVGRSFRAQLFVALSAFFVLPVAGFAGWSVVRLNEEAVRARQLAVTQVLRDVLASAPGDAFLGPDAGGRLAEAAERADAELGVYDGGRLVATTGEVLTTFGLLPPVVGPDAWHQLQLAGERDALELGAGGDRTGAVGYRSFGTPEAAGVAVLATPQTAGDPQVSRQQLDLLLALLLASLVGVLAALLGAQVAARRLSRPVSDLRRAARAFGEGRGLTEPSAQPPLEFEPVFAAFRKMADDVRANQETQEQAARILAWGEMARQVAHEIKNPLTPMRLGLQHLQRVWRERRDRIGPELEETAPRVLAEIDRLDRIARSFSRFGAPDEGVAPLVSVDLARELAEIVPLYRAGIEAMEVEIATAAGVPVAARRDEVKEVLLNLLENARDAGARRVVLRVVGPALSVQDDGRGMSAEMLDRIFEPRFSTTTSGSGLGLAIVRRLVEGWGGTIAVESEIGQGTMFTVRFAPSP